MRHQKCSLGPRASDGTLINPAGLSVLPNTHRTHGSTGPEASPPSEHHKLWFKLQNPPLFSLPARDPEGGQSNRYSVSTAEQTPISIQKCGNFQAHSPHCSLKSRWKVTLAFIKQVPWGGKATRLWENPVQCESRAIILRKYSTSKKSGARGCPRKPTISHFSYHYEQSTILFHFSCFHKQFNSFSLPNYFHYSGN